MIIYDLIIISVIWQGFSFQNFKPEKQAEL